MSVPDAIISAASGLIGAGIGGLVSYRVAGQFWQRERVEATGPLVEARIKQFAKLWELTESGTEGSAMVWDKAKLEQTHGAMRGWFYTDGAGLLLSDASRRQWSRVVELLDEDAKSAEPNTPLSERQNETIRAAMTCLRTRLKQDVHVHSPLIDDTPCRDQPGWNAPPSRKHRG
jgi:hypothetical protein